MYVIDKKDIENYRYAIAKECFLQQYKEYILLEDIEKSNCMRMIKSNENGECIVSIFSTPTKQIDKNEVVYSFYDRNHYKKAVEKKKRANIHIMELSDTYLQEYKKMFEMAVKFPKKYIKNKMENTRILYKNILLDKEDIKNHNRSFYKYYSQQTIEEKKYGVIDGKISFVDPNMFNDPFDVNCFFANNADMSKLFRILCVAPSPKEILMWSYYGSDHKGYCLEYKEQDILNIIMNLEIDGLCIMGEVDYNNNRPKQKSKLNSISITELNFYVQAAFTKFIEWNHEKEYRYVILSDSFSEEYDKYLVYDIPIKTVFNGCRGTGAIITNSVGNTIQPHKVSKHNNKYELI